MSNAVGLYPHQRAREKRLPADGRLIWVALPAATCGIVIARGRVVAAAPYLARLIGTPEREAARRLRAWGAELVPIDGPQP